MTARRAVRPTRSPRSGGAPATDESAAPPRLDGRRAHVLDRAAEYVRLADQGLTVAQIARRRRKSAGHVSILLRLGRALAPAPEEERAALRSPRVTWRLVQRLVRIDVDAASLRKQLRDAVGGFSTHNVDGRQRRGRRTSPTAGGVAGGGAAGGAAGGGTAGGSGAGGSGGGASGVAWGWDASWFASDAVGYATAHVAHLTHVHHVVATRAARAVQAQTAGAQAAGGLAGIDTGQSLRGLQRRMRRVEQLSPIGGVAASAPTPDEHRALAVFAALGRALRDAETAIAALGVTPPGSSAAIVGSADDVAAELAADLDER